DADADILQHLAIGDVDLITVPVALGDRGGPIDPGHLAVGFEHRIIGAKPHGAALPASGVASGLAIIPHPFLQMIDDRLEPLIGPSISAILELLRPRIWEATEIPRG